MKKNNANVVSKFEATMIACRSILKENKKVNKKAIKNESITRKIESGEYDPEIDDEIEIEDVVDDEVEGVTDDILVVTDPELDPEEMDTQIDELQDIVDETPEGEVPTIDDYVNDLVYTCPICGNNFFSEVELQNGDTCPICSEVPDAFILVGDVQDPEEALADENDKEAPVEDEATSEEPIEDEEVPVEDEIEEELECKEPVAPVKKESKDLYLDEKTFNPLLTKFVRENYKNADKMTLESAKLVGSTLKLECLITYKSGKTKATTITVENFKKSSKLSLKGKLDSAFKAESSKKAHVTVEGKTVIGKKAFVIKAESFKYNFTAKTESARYQVSGSHKLNG